MSRVILHITEVSQHNAALYLFFRSVMNHVNQPVAYPPAQRLSATEIPIFCAVTLKTETLLEQNI
jgi:hypothetical protein